MILSGPQFFPICSGYPVVRIEKKEKVNSDFIKQYFAVPKFFQNSKKFVIRNLLNLLKNLLIPFSSKQKNCQKGKNEKKFQPYQPLTYSPGANSTASITKLSKNYCD